MNASYSDGIPSPTASRESSIEAEILPPSDVDLVSASLDVEKPPERVTASRAGRGRGRPSNKTAYEDKGTIRFRKDATLGVILRSISEKLGCTPVDIDCTSLKWRFEVPMNGRFKELGTADAIKAFNETLFNTPRKDSIIIQMKPPANMRGRRPRVDEDDEDEEYDERVSKKAKIDDDLRRIGDQLLEKYNEGNCPDHPGSHCFYDDVRKLHFDISESNRRITWANHMIQNPTVYTLEVPPRSSPWFSPKYAIKSTTSNDAPPASTSAAAAPASASPDVTSLFGAMANFTNMMSTAMTGLIQPRHFHTPPSDNTHVHPAAPPVPDFLLTVPDNFSMDDYAVALKLTEVQVEKFRRMEYGGEPLIGIKDAYWLAAGFVGLEWERLVAKDRAYRESF